MGCFLCVSEQELQSLLHIRSRRLPLNASEASVRSPLPCLAPGNHIGYQKTTARRKQTWYSAYLLSKALLAEGQHCKGAQPLLRWVHCIWLLGSPPAAGISGPGTSFPLSHRDSSLLHQTCLWNVHGVRNTRPGLVISLTALGPDLGSTKVNRVACCGYTGYCKESQMTANATCTASNISYRALSGA